MAQATSCLYLQYMTSIAFAVETVEWAAIVTAIARPAVASSTAK